MIERREDDALVAKGGWCAPFSPLYDLSRPGYEFPDDPHLPNWDNVVASRLTHVIALSNETRRRLRAAWLALTTPPREIEDDDEW